MRILVTGSAGHLGEAIMRSLHGPQYEAIGLDIKRSPFTQLVGSITDRGFVRQCIKGVDGVLHTATLHKPHIASHSRQDFVDTNITGTLNLLEEAAAARIRAFVYTSTTSTFGRALTPPADAPAAWITEEVTPIPKNIYGATKLSAEHLCEMFHHTSGMPCLVLRTSRFFPEDDDDQEARRAYHGDNLKLNELLYRRVDLEDVVSAHLLALEKAPAIGFDRYIISATSPLTRADLQAIRTDAAAVVGRHVPAYLEEYARRGWSMSHSLDRVYVNERARTRLGWRPRYDFASALERLRESGEYRSPVAILIGAKGYHA